MLLLASTLLLTLLCLFLGFQWYKTRRFKSTNCRIAEFVFRNVDAYVLLIDNNLNVLKTNYYIRHHRQEDDPLPKLGNLLHCKNGTDAGVCGGHALCASCPLRQAIVTGFLEKSNFTKLETTLVIYTSDQPGQAVECHVTVTGNYIPDPQTEGGMLLTIHDITHLKKIQQELSEARRQAEESDRMKSLFLANTSHELRTPLNAILGFSELLGNDCSPEEKQDYMRIIRTNNQLLLQLINDILDLSKIEAGTLEFNFSSVELNTVMEELEGIFRLKQTPGSPVHIEFRRMYFSCRTRTDRQRFTQVVSNFLSNALKFTSSGEILFGFEKRDRELYVYVTDTGKGIPADKVSLIFERFVKIGSHKQGVGIGLAISQSIIESMQGRIGVESVEGKGSTFWFIIPYEPQE